MTGEAHLRIDEGIKRGPRRKPAKPTNNIHARDPETGQALQVIPKDLLPATVIERYLSDEKTSEIALSYGIRRSRLNQWLIEHAEESWRKAQVARAVTALEDSKDELEFANDPLTLARARERLRGAQWELERLYSRLYGAKQEVTVKTEVKIETVLDGDACALLAKMIVGSQAKAVAPSVSCTAIEAEYTVHPGSTQSK